MHASNKKEIEHSLNQRLTTCLREPIAAVPCTVPPAPLINQEDVMQRVQESCVCTIKQHNNPRTPRTVE